MERILKEIMRRKPKADQRIIFRIHASGDFYSEEYLKKWMKIALITKLKNKTMILLRIRNHIVKLIMY